MQTCFLPGAACHSVPPSSSDLCCVPRPSMWLISRDCSHVRGAVVRAAMASPSAVSSRKNAAWPVGPEPLPRVSLAQTSDQGSASSHVAEGQDLLRLGLAVTKSLGELCVSVCPDPPTRQTPAELCSHPARDPPLLCPVGKLLNSFGFCSLGALASVNPGQIRGLALMIYSISFC